MCRYREIWERRGEDGDGTRRWERNRLFGGTSSLTFPRRCFSLFFSFPISTVYYLLLPSRIATLAAIPNLASTQPREASAADNAASFGSFSRLISSFFTSQVPSPAVFSSSSSSRQRTALRRRRCPPPLRNEGLSLLPVDNDGPSLSSLRPSLRRLYLVVYHGQYEHLDPDPLSTLPPAQSPSIACRRPPTRRLSSRRGLSVPGRRGHGSQTIQPRGLGGKGYSSEISRFVVDIGGCRRRGRGRWRRAALLDEEEVSDDEEGGRRGRCEGNHVEAWFLNQGRLESERWGRGRKKKVRMLVASLVLRYLSHGSDSWVLLYPPSPLPPTHLHTAQNERCTSSFVDLTCTTGDSD